VFLRQFRSGKQKSAFLEIFHSNVSIPPIHLLIIFIIIIIIINIIIIIIIIIIIMKIEDTMNDILGGTIDTAKVRPQPPRVKGTPKRKCLSIST